MIKFSQQELCSKLDSMMDSRASERQLLSVLKYLRHVDICEEQLEKLLNYLVNDDNRFMKGKRMPTSEYITEWFSDHPYRTFMDFFTRKLSLKKEKELRKTIGSNKIIIPNECYIESVGDVNDLSSIIRLKKPYDNAKNDLKGMSLSVDGYKFINMKLLISFYHRIHSPVNGHIWRLFPVEGHYKIFGKNALWVIEFVTDKRPVYLMLVGESSIQDFNFLVRKGMEINIMDCLGYFNWGSQTILFYHPDDFEGKLNVKKKDKCFVGDILIN